MTSLTPTFALFLLVTSLLGGALNAVAGGGLFLTLPALIYVGVSPIEANATSAVALWPGSMASAWAYRHELAGTRHWWPVLVLVSVVGGLAGAMLLIRTSDDGFLRLLPWLMLTASLTFSFGGPLSAWSTPRPVGDLARDGPGQPPSAWTVLLQLVIAVYGGYFGGGMGIMMLATLALAGMTDIHAMNGLKALLAVAINGIAVVEFARTGAVAWMPALVMVLGTSVGGYGGAALARRMHGDHVRWMVIAIAWAMTVYFFARSM